MEEEVENLRNDYNIWRMKIVELKQQYNIQYHLAAHVDYLQTVEYRQEHFIQHLQVKEMGIGSDPRLSSFLSKLYELVDDPSTNSIISWSASGTSFFIRDPDKLEDILPKHFNQSKFSSFTTALYKYGFKKIDKFLCEYADKGFQKGKKYLLKSVRTKQQLTTIMERLPSIMKRKLAELKNDQNRLAVEFWKFMEQQEKTTNDLAAVKKGLQSTKFKQQQMEELKNAFQPPNACRAQPYKQRETRPWLDSTKNGSEETLENLKKDLNKLEEEVLNLILKQEIDKNHLAAVKSLLQSAEHKQQQLETSMDQKFNNLCFKEVIKQLRLKNEVDSDRISKISGTYSPDIDWWVNLTENLIEKAAAKEK